MITKKTRLFAIIGLACMLAFVIAAYMNQSTQPAAVSINNIDASGSMVFKRTLGKGIFRAKDPDSEWNAVSKGILSKSDVLTLTAIGGKVYAGTSLGGLFVWEPGTETWTQLSTGVNSGSILSILQSGNILFAGTYWSGVIISTDNGKNWQESNKGKKNPRVFSLMSAEGALFAGTYGSGIYRSTDNGATWKKSNTGLTDKHILALSAAGKTLFAGTERGNIFRSVDNGTTWTLLSQNFNGSEILSFASNQNTLFAGTNGSGLYRTTNSGDTWEQLQKGIPYNRINCLTFNDGKLFAGTDSGGVYVSTDNGQRWSDLNKGFQQSTNVWCLTALNGELFAGAGMENASRQQILAQTSSANRIAGNIPETFTLSQNYPNPFNASTNIAYELPEHSTVKIRIYDVSGKEVLALSRDENAGVHTFTWDASNVASGTYFYRVEASSIDDPASRFTETKKMVLLK